MVLLSLTIGILVFVIAYIGMHLKTGLGVFNQPILTWMVDHRNPIITEIAKIITSTASPVYLVMAIGIGVTAWVIIKREVWRPLLLVGSMGLTVATSTILKLVFMDARPPQINMVPMFEMDYSFPSGHTISIFVLLLVLGYLIYSRQFSAKRFIGWGLLTITGTGLIALSRLYLGYHWLTDVVASVGLGLMIFSIVIIIDLIFNRHSQS